MTPAMKRFTKTYQPVYDAIASVDIDQEDRERVAEETAKRISDAGLRDFQHDLFVLLATDPLVRCVGYDDEPCPEGTVIRIGMHLSTAPDGRSKAWRQRAPHGEIRCLTCGARHFNPNYPR